MADDFDTNPLLSFRFHVEISGVLEGMFLECSGLGAKRKIFKYKEGGVNDYVHQFPAELSYTNVKLKRGLGSPKLFEWFNESKEGGGTKYASLSLIVFGHSDKGIDVVQQWDLDRCYPVKWTVSSFKSDSSRPAIETLELAHHGITKSR